MAIGCGLGERIKEHYFVSGDALYSAGELY